MSHTSQGHYTGLVQLSQLGPHPQAGQEPRLGALPFPSHRLTHSGTGGCSQARGTAHFTPAQPLPDPVRRLWGRCSLPATSWESLGKSAPALLQKKPSTPTNCMRNGQCLWKQCLQGRTSLHCKLEPSLMSLSQAHKDSISSVPNIQKPGKVPILMLTLKNRVMLELAWYRETQWGWWMEL